MRKITKHVEKGMFWKISATWIVLMIFISLSFTVFAATDLTNSVGVMGLIVSGDTSTWKGETEAVSWSGTTTSSGCSAIGATFTPSTGELTLTNDSGEEKVLTFSYNLTLNGGTVTIDGTAVSADGSFSKTLTAGSSVKIETISNPSEKKTTTLKLYEMKLEVKQISMNFVASSGGSYTVDGEVITTSTKKENVSTKSYKLLATANEKYVFVGWYLDDELLSTEKSLSTAFTKDGAITAKFVEDPLYKQANVPEDSIYTKDQLISINSQYYHDSSTQLVKDGSLPGNSAAYSKTAQSGTKDKVDIQYVPSLPWNNNMGVSYSGTAKSDFVTGAGQESFAYVRMLSDVIRIYAKDNCTINFDYSNGMTTSGDSITSDGTVITDCVYTYITTSSNATVAQVKSGTQYTSSSGSSGNIALSKGNYLYILTESYKKARYMNVVGSTNFTLNFDYTASISNFTVEYNEKKDKLTAGFRDNTGKTLGSGTIVVNGSNYSVGTNGNISDMTFADLAKVELKVASAPANYVHIGWEITPKDGVTTYQYTSTYNRTLKEDVTINALFVPKMNIQMGSNGYFDATYTLFDGSTPNGQYVARNSDSTVFYTSLKDAFENTDAVILLASATINGDWTIPAGKTFVIPYGMTDKGNTKTETTSAGVGNFYCVVDLNGNLTVDGTLLISSQQYQGSGAPGGNPGHLRIASEKTITVNGDLYAYGPLTGSGYVNANSTAKVHELVEFADNTVVIYIYNIYNERESKKVFPFNTMFINTIEVPTTYQLGATLTGHVAIKYDTVSTADVPIIGSSGAMMNHSAGTITKRYDRNAGQFVFRFNEDSSVTTGPFSITLELTIAGQTKTITMNTADYYLPMSAPFRFDIGGELTIKGNYKFLPGMSVNVLKGGKLTISSDSNVVFYRRNDYDYRGKHGNSTEQWGYSEKAYPQNPTRFNGVSYPFSFNNSNMGSAKLNVDGEVIVNGGLYVTNEVQTEGNGITLTANGYNFLTGQGSIDMTNANTNLTQINEVMRAGSTNDLAWDTVAVVPIKGLKADATADEAAQYQSLSGIMYGGTNANGLNAWSSDPCFAGHKLEGHEPKDSTCTAPGNSAYWECEKCGKYFGDAQASEEIAESSWVLEMVAHSYEEQVTKQPTLSETGIMTMVCVHCGDSYTEEIPCLTAVAQIGDTKYASLLEALKEVEENGTIMLLDVPTEEVVFGKNVTIVVGNIEYNISCADGWGVIDNEDGSFTIKEGIFKIYASNVKVGDCLDMFFYIDGEDLIEETSYYAKVFKEGLLEASTIPDQEWTIYMIGDKQYKRFSFNGIAAKEMTDEISVTIYTIGEDGVMGTDDDEVASTKCTDSIENYAIRTLNNTPEDRGTLRAILVDLLNYGAACQAQFNYETNDLATARLSDEQKSCATTPDQWEEYNVAIDTSDNYIGASVVTESNLIYRLYFRDLTLTENTKVTITYVNFYGNEKELKLDRSDIIRSEENSTAEVSVYYVDVTEMAVSDGRCLIQCSITDIDAEGQPNEIAYCKNDSIEGAVRRFQPQEGQEAAKNAYDMLLNFVYSAEAYFR